jgi:ABC-type multidrug transport system ATPase subunit
MEEIIKVRNLSKHYKDLHALEDLSFTVQKGEIYGFLGQNGAGKSTTIRILLSLIKPTAGSVELFGMQLDSHRNEILRQVGAVIERPDLYKYLTAYENVALFARLSGIKPGSKLIMDKLELVGLADRAHSKAKTFSQGMKQRLGLAVALIHEPQLVILDEPLNGLDPQGIADIRNLILYLSRKENKTIFVSSHLLNEMEMIADRMLIIDKGRAVKEGSIKELFDPEKMFVQVKLLNTIPLLEKFQQQNWWLSVLEYNHDGFNIEMPSSKLSDFTSELISLGAQVYSISPRHSLEQYFLSLTTANQHVDSFAN